MATRGPASISFVGYTSDPNALQTYTFNTVAIGAADLTRRIIFAAYWGNSINHNTITAASINGVSVLPAHVAAVGSSNNAGDVALFSGLVPTGTTANFSFTLNAVPAASGTAAIAVFRAINESVAAPHAVMTDNSVSANALSGTINIPASGWVLGAGCFFGTSHTNLTWAGATEQYDQIRATGTLARASGALASLLPPETNRAITMTGDGTSPTGGLVAMSWG